MTQVRPIQKPLALRIRPSLVILALSTAATWCAGLFAPRKEFLLMLGACWIVFGVYSWIRLIRGGHKRLATIPVFFVIAICVGVSLPVDFFNALFEPIDSILWQMNSPLQAGKIGHIFCFAMLSLFALRVRRSFEFHAIELVLFISLLAIATEGIQLFVSGRTTSVKDLGFDLLGAIIGVAIYASFRLIQKSLEDVQDAKPN